MSFQWLDYDYLEKEGFTRDSHKVVKDHCEVYIEKTSINKSFFIKLAIPVTRLPKGEITLALSSYLLERNGALKGPGFFGIADGIVWYFCLFPENMKEHPGLIEKTVVEMANFVERLGPRVLNLEGK